MHESLRKAAGRLKKMKFQNPSPGESNAMPSEKSFRRHLCVMRTEAAPQAGLLSAQEQREGRFAKGSGFFRKFIYDIS